MVKVDFFSNYSEANRYQILEVIGKGSYGLVCSAIDRQTGEKVAIKKINDVFEHVSDAIRILREIKLLRFLRHPDIVQIKHILLPPSPRDFKDIYIVFELMEADLHQVIKANDDLTPEHFQFFLYQLLRALKFMHSANVFHRDLKPKNILANSDCKLKICDFGLARVTYNGSASAIFWTDYVATRWYRAPELCGSFYSRYTTAVDIWSIGCIFAEVLIGKPLFPGKNIVNQLDLMTDLLGTPSPEVIEQIRNEKARRYLGNLKKKQPIPFEQKFPNVDPLALHLLQKLLAFDAKDRPTAEQALADPYFKGLAKVDREPSSQPPPRSEFEFEKRRLSEDEIREMIYKEILEYHPTLHKQNVVGREKLRFTHLSAVDQLKRQFDQAKQAKDGTRPVFDRKHTSLPRERITDTFEEVKKDVKENSSTKQSLAKSNTEDRAPLVPHKPIQGDLLKDNKNPSSASSGDVSQKETSYVKRLVKSASVNVSPQVQQKLVKSGSISVASHIQQNSRTEANCKRDEDSNIKKQEKADEVRVHQSRPRSMGSTVAKLVAAFSNGMV